MFIENEQPIEIKIHYKKSGRHYVVYSDEVFDKVGLSSEEKKLYQELNIKARPLTWGLYNDLQETAMVPDNLGNRKWNYKVYKENKLRKIVGSWDATMVDDEGKTVKVPVNPQTIANLSPDIAESILNVYDKMTLIDEDAEKKS
ncbi:MAG: hypothetical protein WC119_01790 [Synergistaceae bacterium]